MRFLFPYVLLRAMDGAIDGALHGLLRMQHPVLLLLMQQTMAALVFIGVSVDVGGAVEDGGGGRPFPQLLLLQ